MLRLRHRDCWLRWHDEQAAAVADAGSAGQPGALEGLGMSPDQLLAVRTAACAAAALGDYHTSCQALEVLITMLRTVEGQLSRRGRHLLCRALCDRSRYEQLRGRPEAALHFAGQASSLAEVAGEREAHAAALLQLGLAHESLGHWEEAVALLDRAARAFGVAQQRVEAHRARRAAAGVRLALNQRETAQAELQQLLLDSPGLPLADRYATFIDLGRFSLAQGRVDRAWQWLRAARNLLSGAPDRLTPAHLPAEVRDAGRSLEAELNRRADREFGRRSRAAL